MRPLIQSFDGMGQKQSFDSDKPKDMNGQFGKPIKEMLEKKYDMIIDPFGKVLMVMPESFTASGNDSRMAVITNMMKEVVDVVQPPGKGKASFFNVIPEKDGGLNVGDAWTSAVSNVVIPASSAACTQAIAAASST